MKRCSGHICCVRFVVLTDHSSCLLISNIFIINPKTRVRSALLTIKWDERTECNATSHRPRPDFSQIRNQFHIFKKNPHNYNSNSSGTFKHRKKRDPGATESWYEMIQLISWPRVTHQSGNMQGFKVHPT